MKRISTIEFLNYKAFYGTGENNKLKISKSSNVLIYGENGSGKSSIYEGVKQFLASSIDTQEVIPARNLRVKEFYEVEEIKFEDGKEIKVTEQYQNEIGVKICFNSLDAEEEVISTDEIVFTNKENTTTNHNFLRQALSLNSFLSYRELLKTYLVEDPKNKEKFQVQLGKLLIETILAERINSVTQTKNIDEWEHLFTPRIRYKEHFAEQLKLGVLKDIENINLYLKEFLHYFDQSINVKLILLNLNIEYLANESNNRMGLYPNISADIEIEIQELKIEDFTENENHLTVLNEARLSSLAISIYLSSIISTPQENFDFKILFLDDIFIGLDMSNRLPLLEIITKYEKPIVITDLDTNGDYILKYELKADGKIKREDKPFFSDYQIFITTYDRNWYEVAKDFLKNAAPKKWTYFEMYKNDSGQSFDVPAIYSEKENLKKAEDYINQHDYRAAAVYLRTDLENKLQKILPQSLQVEIKNENATTNSRSESKKLNDSLIAFEQLLQKNNIPFQKFENLKLYKSNILNALSHNDITSTIYKRELILAMNSIGELENLKLKKVNPRLQDLELRLTDNSDVNLVISLRKRDIISVLEYENICYLINDCNFQMQGIKYGAEEFVPTIQDFNSFSELIVELEKSYDLRAIDLKDYIFTRENHGKPSESILQCLQ